jgi:hypothetical protein
LLTSTRNIREQLILYMVSALAAANRFLHAWQTEGHETGIMMLSDSARQNVSPDKLQSFFCPGLDAAYEIGHGTRVNSAAYEFRVVLFGAAGTASHPHVCRVIVIRSGKNDWASLKTNDHMVL